MQNKRLIRDYSVICKDGPAEQIRVILKDDNIRRWHAEFLFDESTQFGRTLKANGFSGVLMELVFEDDYPQTAPFVRVLRPELGGGYIQGHGSLCMQSTSKAGWSPAMTPLNLLMSIRALMLSNDVFYAGRGGNFTEQKAREIHAMIMNAHGWGAFIPKKPVKNEEKPSSDSDDAKPVQEEKSKSSEEEEEKSKSSEEEEEKSKSSEEEEEEEEEAVDSEEVEEEEESDESDESDEESDEEESEEDESEEEEEEDSEESSYEEDSSSEIEAPRRKRGRQQPTRASKRLRKN